MRGGVVPLGLALFVSLAGCGSPAGSSLPVASGTYQGSTEDGRPLRLTLSQDGLAVAGHGELDGRPVAVAGSVAWSAVADVTDAEGRREQVRLTLLGDGRGLSIASGDRRFDLARGEPDGPPLTGPFTGRYEARAGAGVIAELTLSQRSSLLSGTAVVFARPAGVSGRVTGADTASAVVTFGDASQLPFDVRRESDGALTVLGLGEPVVLERP
jgi:hypothetical protein